MLFRVPLNVFNVYQGLPAKYPQLMNYYTVVLFMGIIMITGKGAEKITINSQLEKTKAELRAAIEEAK